MPQRPSAVRLPGFDGTMFTLPANEAHYELLARNGAPLLLLGYGPDAAALPIVRDALKEGIYCFQSPAIARLIAKNRLQANFVAPGQMLDELEATRLFQSCRVYFYKPCLRMEPDFWGPFLGRLQAEIAPLPQKTAKRLAHLPGDSSLLLHQELSQALGDAGFEVFSGNPSRGEWPAARPDLLLSINFHGLDNDGRVFNYYRAMNVPAAVWMVDNPWHLLSAIRLPWWKEAHIFVTDPSFIPDLRKEGAINVSFLPLGAAAHMTRAVGAGMDEPVFVGRSAFPERERYFAAAKYPPELAKAAAETFAQSNSRLPDFHWWREKLPCRLWPGFEARKIGHGAEDCARFNRLRWLKAGLARNMRIYGDSGWRELLPGADIHEPVDYYGQLPQIYASALAVLNVTSLLLPQSLSQRHFDVWAANGLLLSDATRGLEIFPRDLVRPICLTGPEELAERLDYFAARPQERRELIEAWREHILTRHMYGQRVGEILEKLGI